MTILTQAQAAADDASMADLLETYKHLTGNAPSKFASIAIGKTRVAMAFMAAAAADEQTGVPKGAKGEPKGRSEIKAKAKTKGVPTPPGLEEEAEFPPGSMAAELTKATKAMTPIVKREKKAPGAPGEKRTPIYAVQATFAGTSKPQPGSERNNILVRIQDSKNNAATLESLDKHFEKPTKGFIQKLIEVKHLVALTEEEYKAAKPTKPKA